MTVTCKKCGGSGQVEFTKEHGGPRCNNCAGQGTIEPKLLRLGIASILDGNSVYMGGPSEGNRRRADRIIEYLIDMGAYEPSPPF